MTIIVVVIIVKTNRSFNSAGLQTENDSAGADHARFKELNCRSGATGGASLMLPVSNSDSSVHLLPPDLCLSLLIASTAGLSHQVKTTDPTGIFPENFASGICVIRTKKAVDEPQREENRADDGGCDVILAANLKRACVRLSRCSSWLCSDGERTGCHPGGLVLLRSPAMPLLQLEENLLCTLKRSNWNVPSVASREGRALLTDLF